MSASRKRFKGEKTPYNFEVFDSGDELLYAKELERDGDVLAWTKKHNIVIKYRNKKSQVARYFPDFLVRRKNQSNLELVEVKGEHLRHDPDTDLKKEAAEDWCRQRGMTYRLITFSS